MEKAIDILKKFAIPIILLIILIGVIIGIVNFVGRDETPVVSISEPKGEFTSSSEDIVVKGDTNSLNNEIFVNGVQAEISDDKSFQAKVPLDEGENEITIEVVTRSGREITQRIEGTRASGTVKEDEKITDGEEKEGDSLKVPEGGVVGDTPAVPDKTLPTGEGEEALPKSGPKENAAIGFGILVAMLYFYFHSKKVLFSARR